MCVMFYIFESLIFRNLISVKFRNVFSTQCCWISYANLQEKRNYNELLYEMANGIKMRIFIRIQSKIFAKSNSIEQLVLVQYKWLRIKCHQYKFDIRLEIKFQIKMSLHGKESPVKRSNHITEPHASNSIMKRYILFLTSERKYKINFIINF